jgi:circadian clock protein KaiB
MENQANDGNDGNDENDATEAFENAVAEIESRKDERYVLRLYVTGTTPKSMRAIANLRRICEEHLQNRYDLEVIDLYQQPALAEGEQIIAAPTLIKKLPAPLRRMIGDMSDTERVLVGLDLRPTPA